GGDASAASLVDRERQVDSARTHGRAGAAGRAAGRVGGIDGVPGRADEPRPEWAGSTGFRAGPKALVSPVPAAPKSSMLSLPAITPPASRMRSTTTASALGTYAASREPFVVGTPATETLSLTPTVRPRSGPSGAPATRHVVMNA